MIAEENKSKIVFCERNKYEKLYDYICQNQLENKYGGFLKDFTIYWPPNFKKVSDDKILESIKKNNKKRRKFIKNYIENFNSKWIIRICLYLKRF